MSKDIIYRQDAIDALAEEVRYVDGYYVEYDAVISETDAMDAIKALPSAQKTGNWTDKSIFYGEEGQIDMWQTCKCSKCGRFDTRPYMYYFSEPNYCSYCGAKRQKGEANE